MGKNKIKKKGTTIAWNDFVEKPQDAIALPEESAVHSNYDTNMFDGMARGDMALQEEEVDILDTEWERGDQFSGQGKEEPLNWDRTGPTSRPEETPEILWGRVGPTAREVETPENWSRHEPTSKPIEKPEILWSRHEPTSKPVAKPEILWSRHEPTSKPVSKEIDWTRTGPVKRKPDNSWKKCVRT